VHPAAKRRLGQGGAPRPPPGESPPPGERAVDALDAFLVYRATVARVQTPAAARRRMVGRKADCLRASYLLVRRK
jgi:hypothetical protein